jgi:hypothetical protein
LPGVVDRTVAQLLRRLSQVGTAAAIGGDAIGYNEDRPTASTAARTSSAASRELSHADSSPGWHGGSIRTLRGEIADTQGPPPMSAWWPQPTRLTPRPRPSLLRRDCQGGRITYPHLRLVRHGRDRMQATGQDQAADAATDGGLGDLVDPHDVGWQQSLP